MNFRKILILPLALFLLTGCKTGKPDTKQDNMQSVAKSELNGNFRISGAYALYPLVKIWSEGFMRVNPGVKIDITINGTGEGLQDLQSKKSQLAMVSRPMNDSELDEGIWAVPVAKDGVAPIVNKNNPYLKRILERGLSPDEFLKVFTSDKPMTWGELLDTTAKEKAIVFIRKDESGAADVFAAFLNKESSDLKGIAVIGDLDMIKSVQNNPFGIGFCNFSYAFEEATGNQVKDIQIIPADLDYDNKIDHKEIPFNDLEKAHRGLWLGIYPKSLCRELSMASSGKPSDPAIIEFLRYILTDGQNEVKQSGLCELNDVYIENSLEKIK